MQKIKLYSLADFVNHVESYVDERFVDDSNVIPYSLKMIFAYNDFLNQELCDEMFAGNDSIFITVHQIIKCDNGYNIHIDKKEPKFVKYVRDLADMVEYINGRRYGWHIYDLDSLQ